MAPKLKPKVKRYSNGSLVEMGRGYEDSNAGMKEARDAADEADRIANEAAANEAAAAGAAGIRAAEFELEPSGPSGRATVAKPPIVTKEALAKSGLSLRDYMNQQQGLTRRGGASAPKAMGGSGGGRGPTSEELDSYTATKRQAAMAAMGKASAAAATPEGKAARAKQIESQALEASHPEELLLGVAKAPLSAARGLSALKGLSPSELKALLKSSGSAFSKPGSKANEYVQALLERAPGKLNAPAGEAAKQLPAPTRRLTGPKPLSERDWTGGAIGYRKGGAVKKYASGGSVSASSRGDGIASKGKTRGKMC